MLKVGCKKGARNTVAHEMCWHRENQARDFIADGAEKINSCKNACALCRNLFSSDTPSVDVFLVTTLDMGYLFIIQKKAPQPYATTYECGATRHDYFPEKIELDISKLTLFSQRDWTICETGRMPWHSDDDGDSDGNIELDSTWLSWETVAEPIAFRWRICCAGMTVAFLRHRDERVCRIWGRHFRVSLSHFLVSCVCVFCNEKSSSVRACVRVFVNLCVCTSVREREVERGR